MSFDLIFWYEAGCSTPEEASLIYGRLAGGETGVVEVSPVLDEFFDGVVSVYPDLTDGNMDESPWMVPLYRTPECIIVSIAWSRSREVNDVLVGLANEHGLTAYNPQDRIVCHLSRPCRGVTG